MSEENNTILGTSGLVSSPRSLKNTNQLNPPVPPVSTLRRTGVSRGRRETRARTRVSCSHSHNDPSTCTVPTRPSNTVEQSVAYTRTDGPLRFSPSPVPRDLLHVEGERNPNRVERCARVSSRRGVGYPKIESEKVKPLGPPLSLPEFYGQDIHRDHSFRPLYNALFDVRLNREVSHLTSHPVYNPRRRREYLHLKHTQLRTWTHK